MNKYLEEIQEAYNEEVNSKINFCFELAIFNEDYIFDKQFDTILENLQIQVINEKFDFTKIISKLKELWEKFKKWFVETIKNIIDKIKEIKKKFAKDNSNKKIQSLKQKLNKLKYHNESVIYEEQNDQNYYVLIMPKFENDGRELEYYVKLLNLHVNESLNNLRKNFESINVEKLNNYERMSGQEKTSTKSGNNYLYKDFQENFEKLLDNEDIKFIQDKQSLDTLDILEKKKYPATIDGSFKYVEDYNISFNVFSDLINNVEKQIKKLNQVMNDTDNFVSKFGKLNYKVRENFEGKDEYVKLFSVILKGSINTFEKYCNMYKFISRLTTYGINNINISVNKVMIDVDREYNRIFNS